MNLPNTERLLYQLTLENDAFAAVEAALHNKYGDPLPDHIDAERYKDAARRHANTSFGLGRAKGASN